MREVQAHLRGEIKLSETVYHVPPETDVRALRETLGLWRSDFAARFGFNVRSLQDWEQGRRRGEIPIRTYLAEIQREPQAVMRALRAALHSVLHLRSSPETFGKATGAGPDPRRRATPFAHRRSASKPASRRRVRHSIASPRRQRLARPRATFRGRVRWLLNVRDRLLQGAALRALQAIQIAAGSVQTAPPMLAARTPQPILNYGVLAAGRWLCNASVTNISSY